MQSLQNSLAELVRQRNWSLLTRKFTSELESSSDPVARCSIKDTVRDLVTKLWNAGDVAGGNRLAYTFLSLGDPPDTCAKARGQIRLAEMSVAHGRPIDAEKYYVKAIEFWKARGARKESAVCMMSLAEALKDEAPAKSEQLQDEARKLLEAQLLHLDFEPDNDRDYREHKYLEEIQGILSSHWKSPKDLGREDWILVRFAIKHDGAVSDLAIQTSKEKFTDEAASLMDAIELAAPLPSHPSKKEVRLSVCTFKGGLVVKRQPQTDIEFVEQPEAR